MMRLSPIMPVIAPGAKFQPVYVGDVADAVVAALASDAAGKTYELGGPQVLTMGELLRWIADATGRSPLFVDVPDVVASALATGRSEEHTSELQSITSSSYRLFCLKNNK